MRLLSVMKFGGGRQGGGANAGKVERDRKGFAPFFSVGDSSVQRVVGQRIFTPAELFRIYQITPDVRAPVDKITLRVSNTPWLVTPAVLKSDPAYDAAREIAAAVTAWLSRPNTEDDWTQFVQKWAQNTLLYDAHAVERVFDTRGRLAELVALQSGDITPLQDEHGRVYAYRQDAAMHGPVMFTPDELDYGNLFANTMYPNGQPILETAAEEFITMRAQAQHLRRLVDADEIPPGILALIGVGETGLKRFEARWKAQAGRDDMLRLASVEEAGGKVEWIQLQRSLKDLEWLPNIREVRKTLWRLFHVTPVTMGETDAVPRASAEVQVEIADQGLIGPMFRKLERVVNERWIPLWVGNPDLAKLIYFSFDTTPDLSQEDQKTRAERLSVLVGSSILTVNEAREELGYDPVDVGDDVAMAADAGGGADTETDAEQPAENTTGAPRGTASARRSRPTYHRTRSGVVVRGELPSDWQPSGRFQGKRTLPLSRLGALVREYDDAVTPLYERCARAILRAATTAVGDGVLTATEVNTIVGAIGRETATLVEDWSSATTILYERAAEIGVDTAVGWGGSEVPWKNTAATYQAGAISYLTASGGRSVGLVTALRRELTELVLATLSRSGGLVRWSEREAERRARVEEPDPMRRAEDKLPAALGLFLEAVRRVFERHQHRISNWSGKLVELAHMVAGQSLSTPVAVPPADPMADPAEPVAVEDRWMVEWVEVSDGATCSTCLSLGTLGFVALDALPTMPGGATECGARCRCVLVFWRESEVQSGKAKRLGPVRALPGATGRVVLPGRIVARVR